MVGGKSYKFRSPSQAGVADRIACFPNGQTWFVELKKGKDGRVSPMQEKFALDVLALKQKYVLLSNKDEIDHFINRVMNPILRRIK